MFGAGSDRAWDTVRDEAVDQSEKAMAVGQRVADEAVKMTDEVAGQADDKTPSGRAAVDKAEKAARGASDRLGGVAKEEADKQKLGKPSSGGSGGAAS